ncbi:hypothetical protein [Vreelandella gomseomensis]|uniref:Uncharacterized protein n=1 Tax=Vreelandella gomseomensis TaxID=370766 RepID=A0ABU1GHQ6_9GAMM|nr:hypothetical protein [Halomonas gomseomensis]MDR5876554.1 hypothetical protein [Halomonas gomseomensis]
MTAYPDSEGSDTAPIPPATRTALLAELAANEHLLFEPMTQAGLDSLYALYDQWQATLGDSPDAIALCDALDDFIGACIEDDGAGSDSVEQAYFTLVDTVNEGGT